MLGNENTLLTNRYTKGAFLVVLASSSLFAVFRTDVMFTDRAMYSEIFRSIKKLSPIEVFKTYSYEPLFLILTKVISVFTFDERIYYVLIYLLFVVILLTGIHLIIGKRNTVYAFVFFLHFWVFYEYILNGLRQGLAMAFIVVAIGYTLKKKSVHVFMASLCACLFHFSSLPVVLFIIFLNYKRKSNIISLIVFFIVFALLYVTGLNQALFSNLQSSLLENYSDSSLIEEYGGSNKLKFLLFNSLFLIAFYLYYRKNKLDETFTLLYKSYILFSIYFMAFGFIAFSNRISAYSWFLIPLMTAYIAITTKNKLIAIFIALALVVTGYVMGIHSHFSY